MKVPKVVHLNELSMGMELAHIIKMEFCIVNLKDLQIVVVH